MENHVKLSVGLNFSECTPIKGTFKGFATQTVSICFYRVRRRKPFWRDVQLQKRSAAFQKELDHAEQQQQ
jgi:hypothetical protein